MPNYPVTLTICINNLLTERWQNNLLALFTSVSSRTKKKTFYLHVNRDSGLSQIHAPQHEINSGKKIAGNVHFNLIETVFLAHRLSVDAATVNVTVWFYFMRHFDRNFDNNMVKHMQMIGCRVCN